jgi:hypothetical protein
MRRTPVRLLLVAAALAGGMAWLSRAGAADLTDDEFKAVLEQDVKAITRAAEAVDRAAPAKKKAVQKNAAAGIKSAAVNMAGYANDHITGKDPAADARAAAVRDEAIKIFKAAEGKDFKAAAEAAKGLSSPKPAADAKKIDVAKAFGELTPKEIMDNYKKTEQFGTNLEADVQANAKKKGPIKPADAALIAHRVLVMAEYTKTVTKAENAADKKEWDEYNAKMTKAGEELLAATKKKSSPADFSKLFTTLDASCTACHDKFK